MHRPYFFPVAGALLLLSSTAIGADDAAPGLGSSLLQLILGFALILALLFATLWLMKKIAVPRGAAGSLVRVVSAAAVGPRERVVVIEVAGKRLLLGVAPGQVSLLDELAIPPGSTPVTDTAATPPLPEFARWLKRIRDKREGRDAN